MSSNMAGQTSRNMPSSSSGLMSPQRDALSDQDAVLDMFGSSGIELETLPRAFLEVSFVTKPGNLSNSLQAYPHPASVFVRQRASPAGGVELPERLRDAVSEIGPLSPVWVNSRWREKAGGTAIHNLLKSKAELERLTTWLSQSDVDRTAPDEGIARTGGVTCRPTIELELLFGSDPVKWQLTPAFMPIALITAKERAHVASHDFVVVTTVPCDIVNTEAAAASDRKPQKVSARSQQDGPQSPPADIFLSNRQASLFRDLAQRTCKSLHTHR